MCDYHVRAFSRRRFMLSAAALSGVSLASEAAFARGRPAAPPPQNAISPDAALARLMEGNQRYVNNTAKNRDLSAGRELRAGTQHPIAAILSCSDSRVAPELAFDQGPGDIFVIRVAGNFVNEDGLASIEYALEMLSVPLVVVLGHSHCGAVSAALKAVRDNTALPGHLPQLVAAIAPALKATSQCSAASLLASATAENVRLNVRRLQTAEPIVATLVQKGTAKVVGALYDIRSGRVSTVGDATCV
jgi:carbonic anhydrase